MDQGVPSTHGTVATFGENDEYLANVEWWFHPPTTLCFATWQTDTEIIPRLMMGSSHCRFQEEYDPLMGMRQSARRMTEGLWDYRLRRTLYGSCREEIRSLWEDKWEPQPFRDLTDTRYLQQMWYRVGDVYALAPGSDFPTPPSAEGDYWVRWYRSYVERITICTVSGRLEGKPNMTVGFSTKNPNDAENWHVARKYAVRHALGIELDRHERVWQADASALYRAIYRNLRMSRPGWVNTDTRGVYDE